MQMNNLGFALLQNWEKLVLYTYDDSVGARIQIMPGDRIHGTLTIGWGHTGSDVHAGMTWTAEQADEALANDAQAVVDDITPMITIGLNDNQFSAFVCFAYNIGTEHFWGSSALAYANENRLAEVPARMRLWHKTHVNGRLVNSRGLANRREAEIVLWNTPMVAV